MFLEFTLVYRHRWAVETDDIEMATKFIWAKKLNGIDEKIIRESINDATTSYPTWPPTPGEFLEIAKQKARFIKEKSEDALRMRGNLMVKKSDPLVAKDAIKNILEQMKMNGSVWRK